MKIELEGIEEVDGHWNRVQSFIGNRAEKASNGPILNAVRILFL